MTVTEAVTASGITPSADYKGIENTDDFVLAICTEASKKDAVKDWTVCADHVREHSGALNASTSDNTYIRTGPVTTKGSVQRTLTINGDRCKGDAFQDFILGHDDLWLRPERYPALRLFLPAHRQGRDGCSRIHRHQRRGRLCRRNRHLCLRCKGHRHPCQVRLFYRCGRLILPVALCPRPDRRGLF